MIRDTSKTYAGKQTWGAILALLVMLVGTNAARGQEDHHLVQLSPEETREFGLVQAVAGPGVLSLTRTLPAEVRVNENRLAHIVPRYEGIVTRVLADIGDQVRAGQTLAVVESDESLAPYEITTSLAGTVIARHMTLGEPVDRENSGFTVVDLRTVWIDITVYQQDIETIVPGEEAAIRLRRGSPAVKGTISYVTPVVDPHTRTATARLEIDNSSGSWRPGMFVMADITTDRIPCEILIPASAVQTIDGRKVVFVATNEGFIAQPVVIGRKGKTQVEIISGLEAGNDYVAQGGFTLKAELGKESFGEDHDH